MATPAQSVLHTFSLEPKDRLCLTEKASKVDYDPAQRTKYIQELPQGFCAVEADEPIDEKIYQVRRFTCVELRSESRTAEFHWNRNRRGFEVVLLRLEGVSRAKESLQLEHKYHRMQPPPAAKAPHHF